MQTTILLLVLVYWIYIGWFKKIKSYKDLIRRAGRYELVRNRKKAIEQLQWGSKHLLLNDFERSNVKVKIGSLLLKDGNYVQASHFFQEAFDLAMQQPKLYVGEESLREALLSLIHSGKEDNAITLYKELVVKGSIKKSRKIDKLLNDIREQENEYS